jgi:hypothetical protein
MVMMANTHTQPGNLPRALASFHPTGRMAEPLFRDWLAAHRDVLFRWAMARADDADSRRAFAEMAVSIQRLRGANEFMAWLYGAALNAARHQARAGCLPENAYVGLAPELRAVLRLVAHGDMRREEAIAMLAQRMGYVRGRLVQTRLRA